MPRIEVLATIALTVVGCASTPSRPKPPKARVVNVAQVRPSVEQDDVGPASVCDLRERVDGTRTVARARQGDVAIWDTKLIRNPKEIARKLAAMGAQRTEVVLNMDGRLFSERGAIQTVVTGVAESGLLEFRRFVVKGSVANVTSDDGLVLDTRYAHDLGVDVGDSITVRWSLLDLTSTEPGDPAGQAETRLTVAAIAKMDDLELLPISFSNVALVHLERAQSHPLVGRGAASSVRAWFPGGDSPEVKRTVTEAFETTRRVAFFSEVSDMLAFENNINLLRAYCERRR